MHRFILTLSLLALFPYRAEAEAEAEAPPIPPIDAQIAAAVLAAPAELRASARVLAYDEKGKLVEARAGTGELVCVADDPQREGVSVACYHADLEPYMARGRVLRGEGIHGKENLQRRWKEIDAGKLQMPKGPRTLYVLTGDRYDPEKGELVNGYLRWVIYVPYATAETTGLSAEGQVGAPWIMYPGTPGAHIMISPPR